MLLTFRQVLAIRAERVWDEVLLLEAIAKKCVDGSGNVHGVDLHPCATGAHNATPVHTLPTTLPKINSTTQGLLSVDVPQGNRAS